MGNTLDYDKLISMLQIENGEIILVDNRDEDPNESREKNSKSREGARKRVNKDQVGLKNIKKLEEFEKNKKLSGFSKNQDVSEEFYEDDSSENEPKAEKIRKNEEIKENVGESGKISKDIGDNDEDSEEFDGESEQFKGTFSFQDEGEMKESGGLERYSDEESMDSEKAVMDEECEAFESVQDD